MQSHHDTIATLSALVNHHIGRLEFYQDRVYGRIANLLASDSPEAVRATHSSLDDETYAELLDAVHTSNSLERARTGLVLPLGTLSRIAPALVPNPVQLAPHNDPQHVDPKLLAESDEDNSGDENSG